MSGLDDYLDHKFCYLTTRGRVTGRPHEIEIWFVVRGGVAYLMAGGQRSDWVRNLMADERVTLRIGRESWSALGRVAAQDDLEVRRRMAVKYQDWTEDKPLSQWARSALIVSVSPR